MTIPVDYDKSSYCGICGLEACMVIHKGGSFISSAGCIDTKHHRQAWRPVTWRDHNEEFNLDTLDGFGAALRELVRRYGSMEIVRDHRQPEHDLALAVDQGDQQSTTMFGWLVETWLIGAITSLGGTRDWLARDPRIELARLLRKTVDVQAQREQRDQQSLARRAWLSHGEQYKAGLLK
jgi:hypothetical protein